jgi:capsular exopolysaccharide synthesis family protein
MCKWRILLAVLALTVVISVVYAWTATPQYTATATIEIEESKSRKEDRLYGSPEYQEYRSYVASQLELLRSRSLAETVVKRMKLSEHPEFSGKKKSVWRSVASLPSRFFSLLDGSSLSDHDKSNDGDGKVQALAEGIAQKVIAKPPKQSGLATVSLTVSDKSLASDMLRVYLEVYLERSLERKRSESTEASKWLREELEKAEKRLLSAQADLAAFMIDNGIVSGQEKGLGQVMETINKTLEGHIRSREQRLKMQALSDQKRPEAGAVLPKDINTEYVGKLKQQLAQHEADYTELKGVYDPNYPKMQALQKKIKFLRDRINQIEKGIVDTALDTASKEEDLFKQNFDKAMSEAERVKVLEARYSVLKLDVETSSEFHKLVVKEYKEQEIKSRTIVNSVRIVDPPITPRRPSWPKKSLILLVGVLCGVLGGIAAALAADQLDRSIRSPREIVTDYQVQRLAVVPDFTKLPKRETDLILQPPEFMARRVPSSPIADAIRNLQTSIFLGNPDYPVRCMAVSSPTPAQGKTLIAINTASVLANEKRPVVLVDADMRRPRAHKVFGLSDPGKGLADLLASDDIDLSEVIRKDSIPGLSYMTSGRPVGNPADLLRSERLGQLIDRLRDSFAYVVVDCPPVLGFSDTQLISVHSDGIIMVVKQGEVRREELSEALGLILGTQGCRLLGVVFNQAQPRRGFGYRYGGKYHYGLRLHEYYRSKE